jgi:membrane-associated protease RseP (regulator of RpoE activity)
MPTLEETRRALDKDELDYPALARECGEASMPHLRAIVAEDGPRLAPRAAYLAAMISGKGSHEVVALAARSRHAVIRVSAAAAAALLPGAHAVGITSTLLHDPDSGVRVRATKAAAKLGNVALMADLRRMATQDPEGHVRELAAEVAKQMAK